MRRYRCTKIIATLGPTSQDEKIIEQLFLKGADVFRLNFSHGTHEGHEQAFHLLRHLEKKYDRPIGILQDLQGPKLRIGSFENKKIHLKEGQIFRFTLVPLMGTDQQVQLPHPEIFQALEKGAKLLLDDGKIQVTVQNHGSDFAETRVDVGGVLSDKKGVNVPGVTLPISALTAKDRADLEFGLKLGVDWVALSFVQKPEDILEAKELIQNRAGIIAKLEKPKALHHLEAIIQHSDGIMIARGDLGVEMSPEEVPCLQREIIRKSRKAGKPVIVATQMLDSMVATPTPTRAEASDVATAVYDGVDGVMLSAESASGHYPVEAVSMMNRIIERVEQDPLYREMLESSRTEPQATPSDAITSAARQVAHTISAAAIVTFTHSGSTTLRTAYERPVAPILAFTPSSLTAHLLTLVWGTYPLLVEELKCIKSMIKLALEKVVQENFATTGDHIVMTSGAQFGLSETPNFFQKGTTRVLRIMTLGEDEDLLK